MMMMMVIIMIIIMTMKMLIKTMISPPGYENETPILVLNTVHYTHCTQGQMLMMAIKSINHDAMMIIMMLN